MAMGKETYFDGSTTQNFNFFLEHTEEDKFMMQHLHNILPEEFQRIGAGKKSLDVLGVGSGDGRLDVQMLSLLQSTFPAVPITADVVDGSTQLINSFKALVGKTTDLQRIPFAWHLMSCEDYEKTVIAKGNMKKFDFIHMIHMIYYVDDLGETIKFYHSLLKENGRLMIILNAASSGWLTLWEAYGKELRGDDSVRSTSREIIACLKNQGLKYEEHVIPNACDITECFNPSSLTGERLLSFFTTRQYFSQSFTPDIKAGILDLLRNKCSIVRDGRVLFNTTFSCILVHA